MENTRSLLDCLGNPQAQFPAIHIGGTNGKGSVAHLVAAGLQQHGLRVGLYTSPHLISFRERIRVNGQPISRAAVVSWYDQMSEVIDNTDATFFEATTALALADFAARGVDIAVVEVGLGGRLDSTNVLTPLVSCVTHIGLDHQKYLGDTPGEIVREKAGISKPGIPFVIGEADGELATALVDAAHKESTPVVLPPSQLWEGPLGLRGPHQRRNAAVAYAVLSELPKGLLPSIEAITEAFSRTRVAGRLDRRGRWLYDVAHNPDGMRALVAALRAEPPDPPVHALVSILGEKAWPEMLVELDKVIDVGVLTMSPSARARGWDGSWLENWLADTGRPPAKAEWHLIADFDAALSRVQPSAGTILVTGSFHTVGDVLQARGDDVYLGA